MSLSGRRALVTGAGHGIGAAIAVALAEAGADVVVGYGSSAAGAAQTVARIEGLGRKATAVQADVTRTEDVGRLVGEAVGYLGGLEIVVCNAGHLVGRVPVAEMTDEHFFKVLDVNLGSAFRTVRAAIPHLRAAGKAGRVVTMASLAAHNGGGPGSAVYAAAKAGVLGLTKGLAKELAPAGATVNALAPGFIGGTAFHDTFTTPAAQEAIVAGVPLARGGTPAEVAAAVVWLCSDGAGYVTGTTTDIDGGAWFR
ncbi:SDR family oxidoreductase [Nonomuraea sp. K274]|uniref:SDR family oxidoreductase n=1 Tax=Nonomuraea cypriaca TaxID=1187855 RepID=A0A931AAT6_9ACTN|nr:SDR family oxidoreductase [Nonomuraea cypriaca]MBF8188160.1 SDR family oxidoreductase [Nonomuraea cypriaca]